MLVQYQPRDPQKSLVYSFKSWSPLHLWVATSKGVSMNNSNELQLFTFDNHNIRYTEIDGINYASAVDCCKALGYKNPRSDWNKLKKRNPTLGSYVLYTKLPAPNKKRYFTDVLPIEGQQILNVVGGKRKRDPKRIYVCKFEDHPIIKIGVTSSLEKRIKTLESGVGLPLEKCFSIETDKCKSIETSFKKKYKKQNTKGEWYTVQFDEAKEYFEQKEKK